MKILFSLLLSFITGFTLTPTPPVQPQSLPPEVPAINKLVNKSPYSTQYLNTTTNVSTAIFTTTPIRDSSGRDFEIGWVKGTIWSTRYNLLSAIVQNNGRTAVTIANDALAGAKAGKTLIYQPQLSINGTLKAPAPIPTLLATDLLNNTYSNNIIVWDYGEVKRFLRIIEGQLQGFWLRPVKSTSNLHIKYNQSGNISLEYNMFGVNADEEDVPANSQKLKLCRIITYNAIDYYLIQDTLTAYSTASDGDAYKYDSADYATTHDAASAEGTRPTGTFSNTENGISGNYLLVRTFLYFDTSYLGTGANISAATLSLYGTAIGTKEETDAGQADLHVVQGVQGDPIVLANYGDELSKTTSGGSITYAAWSNAYNDIVLNATGRSWISLTGTTKFCTRAAGDINNNTPTGRNYCDMFMSENGGSTAPKLVVTYTITSPATRQPSTSSGTWTNPTNAYTDGGGYAYITSASPSGNETYGGYGIVIASNATISSLLVRMDAWSAGLAQTSAKSATGNDANTGAFTFTGGASLWQSINDSNDATYITGVTNAGGYCTFTYTAFSIPAGATITNITMHYRLRSATTSTAANGGSVLKVGGTYYGLGGTTGANTDPGVSPVPASTSPIGDYTYAWTKNPKTGTAWTVAEINGTDGTNPLQAWGVGGTDFNPDVNFYQVDATVNFVPVGDDQIRVRVTWDAGASWSSYTTNTTTSSEVTYWADMTSATSWTASKLSDVNFYVSVEAVTAGSYADEMRLDWIPVQVTWTVPAGGGWTNIVTINTVGQADISTIWGVAKANIVTINGITP